jgi:hypothetical protein
VKRCDVTICSGTVTKCGEFVIASFTILLSHFTEGADEDGARDAD